MAAETDLPHLLLRTAPETEEYRARSSGSKKLTTPTRDRGAHGARLRGQFGQIDQAAAELAEARRRLGIDVEPGVQLEFESADGFDLAIESLEARASGILLHNVRKVGNRTRATVFVPDGKLAFFIRRIEAYLTKDTPGNNPQNKPLIEGIENVRIASLDALFTDDPSLLPGDDDEIWWEAWIRQEAGNRGEEYFRAATTALQIEVGAEVLRFPEHIVLTARATKRQLSESLNILNSIAELRLARLTADRIVELPAAAQRATAEEILGRINLEPSNVAVCVLDTGVNHRHPLLESVLADTDVHAYDAAWGTHDHHGHGTEMAGLAVYGDLLDVLGGGPQVVSHIVESVKILPPARANPPHLYGSVTIGAVALVEAQAPQRQRVFSLAVTTDDRDLGKPSTWSAALDLISSGYADNTKRLIVVSGGNTSDAIRHDYPDNCRREFVEDPAQAWNVLTVGAYTEKVTATSQDFGTWPVVAEAGALSPFSRTSCGWDDSWPIKPEIVMEGGNCAVDPLDGRAKDIDPLSLLTTYFDAPRLFGTANATSAATSLAARFAARLQARYPDLWPESIRALMVHSADWSVPLIAPFAPVNTKPERERVLRYCGYGVPNFDRARHSASNELTLIAQSEITPYGLDEETKSPKTKSINFHKLPWPKEQLADLRATIVELRVTLSYFIEPNPGERGWRGRYRYASHALRFDVQKAGELPDVFAKRVNVAAREEHEKKADFGGQEDGWFFGFNARHRGSIHSDRWHGTAADLVDHDLVAVYPVVGWWRERRHLGRIDRAARYSLVVSIYSPDLDVNIYTPVRIMVEQPIEIEASSDPNEGQT